MKNPISFRFVDENAVFRNFLFNTSNESDMDEIIPKFIKIIPTPKSNRNQ